MIRAIPLLALGTILLASLVLLASPVPGQAKEKEGAGKDKSSAESLDDQLLEGLSADLFDDADQPPLDSRPASPDKGNTDREPDPPSDLDRELMRELGEDLGQESEDDPLSRIAGKMRQVEELIRRAGSDDQAGELQQQIVRELQQLIDQAQQQQSAGRPGQSSGSRRSAPGRPGKSQSGSGQQPAKGPATDSSDQIRRDQARQAEMKDRKQLQKDIWGHLPERIRERMLQSPVEQFLPKYEMEIEQYFRRLAEEDGDLE